MAKHKPRRPRWLPTADTLTLALHHAAKPPADDLVDIFDALGQCQQAFRTGRATELQWAVLGGSLGWANAIERKGVVRGLDAVIRAAAITMTAIFDRAKASGTWVPPTLYGPELAALDDFVYWHSYQIKQLSRAELNQAMTTAAGQIRQQGDQVAFANRLEAA